MIHDFNRATHPMEKISHQTTDKPSFIKRLIPIVIILAAVFILLQFMSAMKTEPAKVPEKPSGFGVGQGEMWMDITGSVIDGATTAIGMMPKDPGLNESMKAYFDRMNKLNMGSQQFKLQGSNFGPVADPAAYGSALTKQDAYYDQFSGPGKRYG